MIRALALSSVAMALLAGCPTETAEHRVELFAVTKPPPGRTAAITTRPVDDVFEVDLHEGVAVVVRCFDDCGVPGSTCKLTARNAQVLGVRPIFRTSGAADREYALVGHHDGVTALHLEAACVERDYTVTVRPAP